MALPQATGPLVLKPKSCIPCRTRKVKCDRNLPCKNCIQWSQTCTFPSPVRRCRRQRRDARAVTATASSAPDNADVAADESGSPSIDERLEKLEKAVHELTGLVHDNINLTKQNQQHGQGHGYGHNSDQMVQQRSRGRSSHTSFPSMNHFPSPSIPNLFIPRLQAFRDSPKLPDQISFDYLAPLHLHPLQVRACWGIFQENVDPLAKVIHKPTVQILLQRVTTTTSPSSSSSLTKGQEALLFAIYFSSICSLGPEDVENYFSMSKSTAALAYRSATYRALMRAEFLSSSNIFTLQAFVLYLTFTNKTDNTKETWALTGIARRLNNTALTSSSLSSPFERELRTRLWWQLWYLDQRAVEDHGIQPINEGTQPYSPAPNLPLNVDDSDLHPSMTTPPPPINSWTEMSFCLLRFEISQTDRRISYTTTQPLSPSEKESEISTCEQRIYHNYTRFCTGTLPIHWLAKHVSHVLITELRFKIYHHHHHQPQPSSSRTLITQAIEIIDIPTRLHSEPESQRWKWLLSAYLQFLPLAFLLTELCGWYNHNGDSNHIELEYGHDDGMNMAMIERAWDVVETAFSRNEAGIREAGNGGVLRELMGRAKMGRENQKQRQRRIQDQDQPWDVGGLVSGSGFVFDGDEEQSLQQQYIAPLHLAGGYDGDEVISQWDENIYNI